MLLELAPLPVKIEAIVDDPTAGALPRENINVGYDARDSRAPNTWKATATLPDDGSDALTTLNIVKDVAGAGTTITTVGGLFDGDSLARKDPMGGAITYTPVPDAGDARPHAGLLHGGARGREPARRRQGPRRDRRRAARAARELQPRRAAAEPARAPRGAGHEPAHRHVRRLGERAVARTRRTATPPAARWRRRSSRRPAACRPAWSCTRPARAPRRSSRPAGRSAASRSATPTASRACSRTPPIRTRASSTTAR